MELNNRNTILVNIFIILLAVSPAFALGAGNKNLLLIGAMAVSPYFLFRYPIIIPKVDLPLIGLCSIMAIFPLVLHPETMRWSTVLYGYMFCLFFMSYARVLYYSNYSLSAFKKLIEWLIYAYCIVLIIQQFCVLTGLPIFNLSNYNLAEPFKLNSLMAEPSHTARVTVLLMFFYVNIIRQITSSENIKSVVLSMDKKVIFAFLYPIITMGSGTAFLLVFILILGFIDKKSIINICIFIILLIPIGIILVKNVPSAERAYKFTISLIDYNEQKLIREDLSAAIRIVPTIHGMKAVSVFTKEGLFGRGVDADEGLTPLPSVDCGAGSFSIWYNYGFFASILFWTFSLSICFIGRMPIISMVFWLLLCFFYGGINIQIIWFTLVLFYTYKYLTNERECTRELG